MRLASFFGLTAALAASLLASTEAGLGGKKLAGVNYNSRNGPDWNKRCKDRAAIDTDFATLKQVTDTIRIYSLVDCDPIPVLQAASDKGLKVWLGIWTTSDRSYLDKEGDVLGSLIDNQYYGATVVGLHVGSEAIYRGDVTASKAIEYLTAIRNWMKYKNAYNIPLTIADTIDTYNSYPELIDAVDIVSVNQFSFWEKSAANVGMNVMLDRLRNLRQKTQAAGKQMMISETGWSSAGTNVNSSVASPENQALFFKDFYHQITPRNISYYWFSGFDAKWKLEQDSSASVEVYFGIYQEDQTLKSSFSNLDLGSRPVKNIRSPSQRLFLTEKDSVLSLTNQSSDLIGKEQQQWLWDSTTQQIRSMNSDLCLDAYQAWDGGIVHMYACISTEGNQKWTYDSSTGKIKHATHTGFCLDTDQAKDNHLQLYGCSPDNANQKWEVVDPGTAFTATTAPATTAPATTSPATTATTTSSSSSSSTAGTLTSSSSSSSTTPSKYVRFYCKESSRGFAHVVRTDGDVALAFTAQGATGSEWSFDSTTHLIQSKDSNYCLDAYEGWNGGRVHVWACNANEVNQMWDFDSSTGQFKHRTHSGFCLDADQSANSGAGKLQLYGCHLNNNNQVFRQISTDAKAVRLINSDTTAVQYVSQDVLKGMTSSSADAQVWFLDSVTKHIISKWSGECLDGYEAKEGGRVHTWGCIATEANQLWTYDSSAKLLRHASHTGYCLAYDSNNQVQLSSCTSSLHTAAQTFTATQY